MLGFRRRTTARPRDDRDSRRPDVAELLSGFSSLSDAYQQYQQQERVRRKYLVAALVLAGLMVCGVVVAVVVADHVSGGRPKIGGPSDSETSCWAQYPDLAGPCLATSDAP